MPGETKTARKYLMYVQIVWPGYMLSNGKDMYEILLV